MIERERLRAEIARKVTELFRLEHEPDEFVPGKTRVQYAGRVFDERDMNRMVAAVLDFWLTAGPYAEQFEQKLGEFLGMPEIVPVNSGSSANLVAVTALCSERRGERRLRPGDEVIVPATSFPTTVAPLVQNRLIPVFIDCTLGDYNPDPEQIRAAVSPQTRALMFAHTLGNPADMDAIMPIVREHDLIMIEDVCDALGSTFDGQVLGTFAEVATLSFYPAHHITLGEGGAVFTRDPRLARIARSVRDWGRDCWCGYENPPDGKCGRRFEREVPGVSGHYDHRYFFTEIGYNLKLTDPQAALGLAQLEKLPDFAAARKRNFQQLYSGLQEWEQQLLLPRWHAKADPSWFAFPISVRASAPFNRQQLMRHLESARVETRVLFAGNVLRQPGFSGIDCRVVGELPVSDRVLRSTFFVGVYPGLDEARIDYILEVFADFMRADLR